MSPAAGPAGQAPLQSLTAACLERDLGKRWQQLRAKLNTDRFISFMALEVLLNHRDGYCLAKNNFRIYQDLNTGKILFFPHGMDQLFGKADASLLPGMSGLVAKSIMEIPESRQLYKQRLQAIATNVRQVADLKKTIQQKSALLAPALSRQERREWCPLYRSNTRVKTEMAF